jgi:hypothetical protein
MSLQCLMMTMINGFNGGGTGSGNPWPQLGYIVDERYFLFRTQHSLAWDGWDALMSYHDDELTGSKGEWSSVLAVGFGTGGISHG